MQKENPKRPYKIILPGLILVLGILLGQLGWFDWRLLLHRGEQYAHLWWFVPAVIATKVVLYTFALPGSTLIWVAGLLFDPIAATLIIVAGGTGGALAAYGFCRRMSADARRRLEGSRLFQFLHRHSDWATLCAIRILPNFPHSVINYGSGLLALPLPRFLISTVVGFGVKGYLYAVMIRNAATADTFADMVDLKTLGPLFVLAALFLVGKAIRRRGHMAGKSDPSG
ncbi:MAG: VTT domain-containing protein [Desulfatitalea sp.]|nr:VTT domain-containing protein [Desulfatitalea sp.]